MLIKIENCRTLAETTDIELLVVVPYNLHFKQAFQVIFMHKIFESFVSSIDWVSFLMLMYFIGISDN